MLAGFAAVRLAAGPAPASLCAKGCLQQQFMMYQDMYNLLFYIYLQHVLCVSCISNHDQECMF